MLSGKPATHVFIKVCSVIFLRSLLFQILLYAWTVVLCPLALPVFFGPYRWVVGVARLWLKGCMTLLRVCCDLRFEVRGRERLPDGAFFIAAKHQSMWDTMVFHLLVSDPAYILKQELLRVPVYGWFLRRHRMIAIDRNGGGRTLKSMVAATRECLDQGRTPVIFPEGTRMPPGKCGAYHAGVTFLYMSLNVPVVPVALNSGLFWGRLKFLKMPGTITIEFLPPLEPGLNRNHFTQLLRETVEEASERLRLEALERFPVLRKTQGRSATDEGKT